jgi:hypothetical protein
MSVPSTASDPFAVILPSRPYPGLRPFRKDEWAIFFGRERMVDEACHRLIAQHLVVVHGDSGSGKSSLISAGAFKRLEHETARSGLAWRACEARPGNAPLESLAESLAALDGHADDKQRVSEIRRVLNFGVHASNELGRLLRRDERDYICIHFDQFEELFEFAKKHGPEEPTLISQFLVGLLEQQTPGLYAVVTMRSDFLGQCARYRGLAETFNRTQYLLPRMAHSDLLRAIREPATLYSGHVSLDLAERLIADARGGQDELPLIQHGLMALHERKSSGADPSSSMESGRESSPPARQRWRLDLEDYGEPGGLAQLLSDHADRLLEQGDGSESQLGENVFRALIAKNAEGQAIRHPQTLGNLIAITRTDAATLTRFLAPFRREGASFLTPYADKRLEQNTRVDISHEALIRCWSKISLKTEGWLDREFEDGLVWRSLLVQARSFRRDASNVLSAATAKERQQWLASRTPAWAERYGGEWEKVEHLVEASVEVAQSRRRRLVRAVSGALIVLAVMLGVVVWQLDQTNEAIAASLWNRLDFSDNQIADDEMKALWEVALASGRGRISQAAGWGVHPALLGELARERERALQVGRNPEPILRALFLKWPVAQAENAIDGLVEIIVSTGGENGERLPDLSAAASAIATRVPRDRQAARLQLIVNRMSGYGDLDSPEGHDIAAALAVRQRQLDALVDLARVHAMHMRGEDTPAVLDSLFDVIRQTTTIPQLRALGVVSDAVAQRVDAARASDAISVVVRRISAAASGARNVIDERLSILESAARRIAPKVSSVSGAGALELLLTDIALVGRSKERESLTAALNDLPADLVSDAASETLMLLSGRIQASQNVEEVSNLERSVRAVAKRLTPEGSKGVMGRLLEQLRLTDNLIHPPALSAAIESLPPDVTDSHAEGVLDELLRPSGVARTGSPDESSAVFSRATSVVGARVPTAAAPRVLTHLLQRIRETTSAADLQVHLAAAQSVAAQLESKAALGALEPLLSSAARAPRSDHAQALSSVREVLASRLEAEEAFRGFELLSAEIARTTDRQQLEQLETARSAAAARLAAGELAPALASLLRELTRPVSRDQRGRIVSLAQSVAHVAATAEAPAMFSVVLRGVAQAKTYAELEALESIARDIRSDLQVPSEDAMSALAVLVRHIEQSTDRARLQTLGRMVEVVAERLTIGRIADALGLLFAQIQRTANLDQLNELTRGIQAAPSGVDLKSAVSLVAELSRRIAETRSVDLLAALESALQAVSSRLPAANKQTAIASIWTQHLPLIESDSEQWRSLRTGLGGVTGDLSPSEARETLASVYKQLEKQPPHTERALQELERLGREAVAQLDPEYALAILSDHLKRYENPTSNGSSLGVLDSIGRELARFAETSPESGERRSLRARRAVALLPELLASISRLADVEQRSASGELLSALSASMRANEGRTPVVQALMFLSERSSLNSLGGELEALGRRLQEPNSKQQAAGIAQDIAATDDPMAINALAATMKTLGEDHGMPPSSTTGRKGERFQELFDALRTADAAARVTLVQAIQALIPTFNESEKQRATEVMRRLIAWSRHSQSSKLAVDTLVTLLTDDPERIQPAGFIEALVEILKYPTARPEVSDTVLAALQLHAAAPGSRGGLEETLDWISRTHAEVDLDSKPVCPVPLWTQFKCP